MLEQAVHQLHHSHHDQAAQDVTHIAALATACRCARICTETALDALLLQWHVGARGATRRCDGVPGTHCVRFVGREADDDPRACVLAAWVVTPACDARVRLADVDGEVGAAAEALACDPGAEAADTERKDDDSRDDNRSVDADGNEADANEEEDAGDVQQPCVVHTADGEVRDVPAASGTYCEPRLAGAT
jgi:hypothetical protein